MTNSAYQRPNNPRWPLWAMSALAIICCIIFWRSCQMRAGYPEASAPAQSPALAETAVQTTPEIEPAQFSRKLTTGFDLSGSPEGIEAQLVSFIESSAPADKTTWFNFDRLTFKTGSAELDMEKSQAQITNISEVLKAFPSVTLKVGGYTDNTGAEEANMTLSQSRAEAVAKAVAALGVDGSRLDAEGYGSQHPVGPNDTEEGRAQNRRIAVRVKTK
jgi:outer membrane protein OmpA-like peptidoglycan-associated protein